MAQEGKLTSFDPGVGCQPGVATRNAVLTWLGRASREHEVSHFWRDFLLGRRHGWVWRGSVEAVRPMRSAGIAPETFSYNALIGCCLLAGWFQEGAEPTGGTFQALLWAYPWSGRLRVEGSGFEAQGSGSRFRRSRVHGSGQGS